MKRRRGYALKKRDFALPYIVWMVLFTVLPLLLILFYAVVDTSGSSLRFTWEYLAKAFSPGNTIVLLRSLLYAFITTIICLILAYPAAMILAKLPKRASGIVTMLFVLPMWINFLMRTYAWQALLEVNGPINQFLGWFGIPPQYMIGTQGAVLFGLVYNYLPFMLLPIQSAFARMDPCYVQAAEDLGANKWQVLYKVTLPLTRPGVITGITMVFMPTVTTFIISRLLGKGMYPMYGEAIEQQFMVAKDWNTGSALAVVMMVLLVISMAIMRKYDKEDGGSTKLW